MPSGAKKRKAAKKKKVNNADPATHPHGDDDPKHHDEKESDGGEVSSPSSQDHHNPQHPFAEVEEEEVEKREDTSSVRSFVAENESLEGINYDGESNQEEAREEEGVAKIDRELKSEEVFESKSIIIESAKELHGGSTSGSSSSSSSDDESHVLEKKTVVIKTASPVDSVKLADSLSEVATEVSESMPIGEVDNSVKETDSVVSSDKFSLLEEVVHVRESDSVDHSMSSGVVVGSGLKENGEKELLSLDQNTGVSPVVMDFGSQKKEDEVVSTSEEYATSSSDVKDSAAQVIEEKLLLSVNASNGAEHVQETPECSDSQPLVASAPRTVQTTSWKGCCGIFELFTRSNR